MSEMADASNVPKWDIADRMRKALREADVSVSEMSDYLGVSRNTVGYWINGRKSPGLQTLRLWSLRCGVPLAWLRDGTVLGNGPDDGTGGVATIGSLLPFRRVARHVAPLTRSLTGLGVAA